MPIVSDANTTRVAEAFDSVAEVFETTLENDITRRIRQTVYAKIRSLVQPGGSILDINCGIGIDAVELARQGYEVVGIDLSPKMVQQARHRAVLHKSRNVEFIEASFEDLSPLAEKNFDLVLSNFGGLNCVLSLTNVAEQVAGVTKSGGYFVAVVMPPFSLWELVAGFIRFNFSFAFRRLRNTVPATGFGKSFTVTYYSPRKFTAAFRHTFEVRDIRGFNIITPPPHATRFAAHFPRLSRWLEQLEETIAALPSLRAVGDHYLVTLRKKSS